jgi:hypothetical protein
MADKPEDKVCVHCRGILVWYGAIGRYLHTGNKGQFTIRDHAPTPIE